MKHECTRSNRAVVVAETRRGFLASSGALAIAGCATTCPPPPLPRDDRAAALIDGHCHLFNAKDLSAVRFLSYVVARHYPKRAELRATAVEDPDAVDLFFEVFLATAGAGSAPSAATELDLLEGRRPKFIAPGEDLEPQDPARAERELIQRFTDFLGGRSFLGRPQSPGDLQAEADLRELIVRSGGAPVALDARGVPRLLETERREIVRRALSKDAAAPVTSKNAALQELYLPGLVEFVKQLKRFRHCIVDELTHLHRDASKQDPLLLAPAMVDFGRWLRDDPEKGSTFVDQAKVWGAIARRRGGPAVHGYVAYCPLRQVEYEMQRFGSGKGQIQTACGDMEPLALVDDALRNHGFIGVKVYPPMGFRAATNAVRGPDDHPFPEAVLKDVYGHAPQTHAEKVSMSHDLGDRLDKALRKLFARCRDIGAPVMAHGGNSVGANCDTGELADPFYWKPIFDSADAPPIMLAHFGSFAYWSADPNAPAHVAGLSAACQTRGGKPPLANTWEAWLARYLQDPANSRKPIYADISYFSEALSEGGEAEALTNFRWLEAHGFTVIKEHLVFGTDWVMLAREKNAQVYSERVRAFVRKAFGDAYVEPIMRTNFLRYAALAKDNRTFKRIASVYAGDAALTARLATASA